MFLLEIIVSYYKDIQNIRTVKNVLINHQNVTMSNFLKHFWKSIQMFNIITELGHVSIILVDEQFSTLLQDYGLRAMIHTMLHSESPTSWNSVRCILIVRSSGQLISPKHPLQSDTLRSIFVFTSKILHCTRVLLDKSSAVRIIWWVLSKHEVTDGNIFVFNLRRFCLIII